MTIRRLAQRVDLNLRRVLVLEDLVQANEDICCLALRTLALETELLRKVKGLGFTETLLEVDRGGDDGIWVLRSDLLDVHATLCGRNQDRAANTTVIKHRNIVLVRRVPTLGQHHLSEERASDGTNRRTYEYSYRVADASGSTSLLGNELRTNHLACIVLGLLGTCGIF